MKKVILAFVMFAFVGSAMALDGGKGKTSCCKEKSAACCKEAKDSKTAKEDTKKPTATKKAA